MKDYLKIFLIIFIALCVSCGPSQEEQARKKLNRAKIFLQNRDTTRALLEIDSISNLYPKAMYSISAAKNLKNEIYMDLIQRYENELDSVNSIIEKLEKNFIQEKTENDRYTQYTHKRQNFEDRWNKSYLKVHLDEMGEIYFSSNYYGSQSIDHTGIRVYDGPEQARTEIVELNDVNNHRSDFLDGKWEKVTYLNGKENNVIEFVANNTGRRLKAVYLGEKYYYIILEDYDKKAFNDAYSLSKTIKRKLFLEKEINQFQSALNVPHL